MQQTYSPAPAWPTLPDSYLSSANHSQDQAALCRTTGFMARHSCQILNTTSDESNAKKVRLQVDENIHNLSIFSLKPPARNPPVCKQTHHSVLREG